MCTHNVCTPPSGRVDGYSVNPVLSPVLISNLLANEENGIASGHSINDKAELEPRSPDTEQNKLFSCFDQAEASVTSRGRRHILCPQSLS